MYKMKGKDSLRESIGSCNLQTADSVLALSAPTVSNRKHDSPGAVQVSRVVPRVTRAQDHIAHIVQGPAALG